VSISLGGGGKTLGLTTAGGAAALTHHASHTKTAVAVVGSMAVVSGGFYWFMLHKAGIEKALLKLLGK
jgi:hypothetical protein